MPERWFKDCVVVRGEIRVVEPEKVMLELHMLKRGHEFRAYDAHVIGGIRYAKTADAARARGWNDIADFIETFGLLSGAP